MHTIYTTPAYILKTKPFNEADKLIIIFTRDLGLLVSTAQGIRYEKSKLRFALQDFSKANISLVQGKAIWRITNAEVEENLFSELEKDKFNLIARVFALLERLVQGEEVNPELFTIIDNGIKYLKEVRLEEGSLIDIECVWVLRILNNLGYIGGNKNLGFFTMENSWDNDLIEDIKKERREALREINRALKESQL